MRGSSDDLRLIYACRYLSSVAESTGSVTDTEKDAEIQMARRLRYEPVPNRSRLTSRRIVNFVRVWIQNHFHDFEELGCYDLLNSFIGLLQVTGMSKASENLRSILHRKVRCMRLRDRCLNVTLVQNEEFKAMRADLGKTPDNVATKKDRTASSYALATLVYASDAIPQCLREGLDLARAQEHCKG